MSTSLRWFTLALAAGVCAAGCEQNPSTPPPPRTRVTGSVTYNGKPASGFVVTFHLKPVASNTPRTRRPVGEVRADGMFEVSSYGHKDGLPPGDYAVTVQWPPDGGQDPTAGRYSDPNNPAANVTITDQEMTLPPIALTGPAAKRPVGEPRE